jgi:hypothetical protein
MPAALDLSDFPGDNVYASIDERPVVGCGRAGTV